MLAAHTSPSKAHATSSKEADQIFDSALGISSITKLADQADPRSKKKSKEKSTDKPSKSKAAKSSKGANSSLLNMFDDPDYSPPSSSASEDTSSSSSDASDESTKKTSKKRRSASSELRNPFFNPSGNPFNRDDAQMVVTQALASTSHIRLTKISIAALKRFTDDIQSFKLRYKLDKAVAYVKPGPREQIINVKSSPDEELEVEEPDERECSSSSNKGGCFFLGGITGNSEGENQK